MSRTETVEIFPVSFVTVGYLNGRLAMFFCRYVVLYCTYSVSTLTVAYFVIVLQLFYHVVNCNRSNSLYFLAL